MAALSAGLIFASGSSAEKRYVIDQIVIMVRSGPSVEHRITAHLKTGDQVDILEQSGDWAHIQYARNKEGWVLGRYLIKDAPNALRAQKLTAQVTTAQERLAVLEKDNLSLRTENESLKATLASVEGHYTDLKQGAEDYQRMKEEYHQATKSVEELRSKNHELSVENSVLKDVRNLQWFLAGSGVTATAWLFGFFLGRTRRKKKSGITFSMK